MAAAAEKPFMILSVYFTTTDVYKPPTLARTGRIQLQIQVRKIKNIPRHGRKARKP